MRILYLIALPAIAILVGLFLIVSEIGKALERHSARMTVYSDLRRHEDPRVAFSLYKQHLLENQSFLDLSITRAVADLRTCNLLTVKMINEAEKNLQDQFLIDAKKYESIRCGE